MIGKYLTLNSLKAGMAELVGTFFLTLAAMIAGTPYAVGRRGPAAGVTNAQSRNCRLWGRWSSRPLAPFVPEWKRKGEGGPGSGTTLDPDGSSLTFH